MIVVVAAVVTAAGLAAILLPARRYWIPVTSRREADALAEEARAVLAGRASSPGWVAVAGPAMPRPVPGRRAPRLAAPDRPVAQARAALPRGQR